MPTKTYMVVDPRHHHSFRVPRPDLSAKLCHHDKPARWATEQLKHWLGHEPQGYQHYAETLHSARTGAAEVKEADTRIAGIH